MVPVLIELVFVVAMSFLLLGASHDYDKLERSRDALIKLHQFEMIVVDALLALAGEDGEGLEKKISDMTKIQKTIENKWGTIDVTEHPELADTFRESESAREKLFRLVSESRRKLIFQFETGIRRRRPLQNDSAMMLFMEVRPLTKRIIDIEAEMLQKEPGQIEQLTWSITAMLLAGALLGLGASVLLVRSFTTAFLHRLSLVERKAILLAAGKDLPPAAIGDDEIAELDNVLVAAAQEIKDARQKQFAILDNARDIICSLDTRMRFETSGASTSKIWQFTPDELLGRSVLSILTPDTQERTRTALVQLAGKDGETEFENAVICSNGDIKSFLWTVSWSQVEKNYFCVAHDITDVKTARELKKQFLELASEELRTPLETAGTLLSSLLSDTSKLPGTSERELQKATLSLSRLTELVNELLDLEALEANRNDLSLAPVEAAQICNSAIDALEALAQSNRLKIVRPQNSALINADERRLIQVLTNLLSNAIKFSPADSTITVEIERQNSFAHISVNDQGPGIPESERALIFDKFHQTRAQSNVNIKGTGLGLAIVKSIVEAHGGKVGVDQVASGGSSFYIRIPIAEKAAVISSSEGDS